ncbi:MAG: class I SAM-dependent methyltransferase, partial [Deltaproteobacteria bacterium]|nr:class I SAM-dependent methyltransferase [Deltaproteobacteria bacterium]
DEKVLLDKYTIIEANQPRRIVYNWLQHYSFDALQREFNQNNLTIRGKFANVAGEDFSPKLDEFAIIAVQ